MAAPGTASMFTTTTGTPNNAAATVGATLAYPPTATTTEGRRLATSTSDAANAATSPHSARTFDTVALPERLRLNPRPPSRVTGNSTPDSRLASRPRREPTSSTSLGDSADEKGAGDRESRHRVTAGPAACDEREAPQSHGAGRNEPAGCIERPACDAAFARESASCWLCRCRDPCEAMFTRIPAAASVITSDEPPNEMNGRGIPVTGRTSMTAPMLITAWLTIQNVIPTASNAAKRSGASRAARRPSHPRHRNRPRTTSAPMSPGLFADHREDEVGVRVREKSPLLAPGTESEPVEPTRSDPDQGLDHLVAGPATSERRG